MNIKIMIAVDLINGAEIVSDTKYDSRLLARRMELKNGERNIILKANAKPINDDDPEDIVVQRKADNKYQIICYVDSDFYKLALNYYLFKR